MADIFEFPGRHQAPVQPHGGYPTPPSIGTTASEQVVAALKFYAAQGYDHGEAARKALIAMNTAIEANHQTT